MDKAHKLSNCEWNMPLELTFENISISGVIISEYGTSIETYSFETNLKDFLHT
jgi:hypothetical protein